MCVCLCVYVCRYMSFNLCIDLCYHHHNPLLFSHSVMFDSLWSHGLQHTRLSCPSPSPGDCSNSCPLRRWCHPTISYSVIPFSSCLQSFPALGPFLTSQLFTSGGQILDTKQFHFINNKADINKNHKKKEIYNPKTLVKSLIIWCWQKMWNNEISYTVSEKGTGRTTFGQVWKVVLFIVCLFH